MSQEYMSPVELETYVKWAEVLRERIAFPLPQYDLTPQTRHLIDGPRQGSETRNSLRRGRTGHIKSKGVWTIQD